MLCARRLTALLDISPYSKKSSLTLSSHLQVRRKALKRHALAIFKPSGNNAVHDAHSRCYRDPIGLRIEAAAMLPG